MDIDFGSGRVILYTNGISASFPTGKMFFFVSFFITKKEHATKGVGSGGFGEKGDRGGQSQKNTLKKKFFILNKLKNNFWNIQDLEDSGTNNGKF